VGFAYRQVVTGTPPGPEVESNIGGYSGISASGRESAALGGQFKPFELPIGNSGPDFPTGQRNTDCQLGQRGFPLGAAPLPGQPPDTAVNIVSDVPGTRGPTTLFWNADQEREILDTRIASRAPETWEALGR
jgi:hypothetical protein